jgi:hypothetical protein
LRIAEFRESTDYLTHWSSFPFRNDVVDPEFVSFALRLRALCAVLHFFVRLKTLRIVPARSSSEWCRSLGFWRIMFLSIVVLTAHSCDVSVY